MKLKIPHLYTTDKLPFFISLLFFLCCVAVSEITINKYQENEQHKQFIYIEEISDNILATIETSLNDSFHLYGLQAYLIATQGKTRPEELNSILAKYFRKIGPDQVILDISIAPDNQIKYIYPLIDNEKALGLNLTKLPKEWSIHEQAIQKKQPVLIGPIDLAQGVSGLIYSVPVFAPENNYWGMLSVVINTDHLFNFINEKMTQQHLQVALRGRNGDGERGEVFWGDAKLFDDKGVLSSLKVPGGSWQLIVKPVARGISLIWLAYLTPIVLAALVAVLLFNVLSASRERRKNDEKLSKITRQVPGMVYQFHLRIDGSSCFPFANEAIRDIYRLSPEEVREDASKVFAILHPDDYDDINASIQKSAQDLRPWHCEYRVKFDDGTVRWLLGDALPQRDTDGSTLWHGFITDITERKQAESQLQLSDTALNAITSGVLITDTQQNIIWINKAFELLSGYNLSELIGQNCRFFQGPQTDPETIKPIRLALKQCRPFYGEIYNYRKDGTAFWKELTILPIFNDKGDLTNFMSISRDMTKLKQAEAALLLGKSEAEHANLVKSQFLAMMSHEIRTPLHAILGMQELLTHTPLNTIQTNYLKVATQAGINLLAIANDILDLTKVESGKLILECLTFNVIELTQHCVELVRANALAKDLTLHTVIPPELNRWLSGDPLRYHQVLINLLSNAIKFTKTGSITIKLKEQPETEDHRVLLVEVIDTGIGIPLAAQAGLFEVFVQVDASDTRQYGGSGLGLAISKRLVDLWKGHIGVESTPDIGSRFWFTAGSAGIAPAQVITPTLIPANENTSTPFAAKLLLVDDSLINQTVLSYMLTNAGHQVDLADSGSAGIAAVKSNHYDLILMDVSMPDMSGMEATAIIRQLGGAAAVVPIIGITAHALAGYQELCLAAGMNGYATKPINQKDLLAVVATWCDKTVTHLAPVSDTLIEDSSVQPVYEPDKQVVILDQAALDELISLLGQEAFNKLLQTYQTELATRCEAIKQAIIQPDLAIISREAHTIKSSSASFGATALQAIAKDIEACGYSDDLPQALILAGQLLPCATATMEAITSIYIERIA